MSTIKTFSQVVGKTFKTSYVPNDTAIVLTNCEFTIHAVSPNSVIFLNDYTGETHPFEIEEVGDHYGTQESIVLENGDHCFGRVYPYNFK